MGSLYKRGSGSKYYGEFTAPDGRRIRRSTGTSVKSDAAKILARWEADANIMRHGLPVDGLLLADLINQFADSLGDDQYRENTEQRIRRLVEMNQWVKPMQINQHELESTIAKLKKVKNAEKDLSARSKAHYITAIKMFTRWMHRVRRAIPFDPLDTVRKPNHSRDRKLVRRFLLPEEWKWLAQTPNALLYETAIQTGLRSNELRMLKPAYLKADHILLPGTFTKNGETAQQWITPALRDRLADALPFELPPREEVAQMLYDDLALARDLWIQAGGKKPADFLMVKNAEGHVLDFHALRHTCGAWLAISGVNPKVIQKVMRHSTIVLTLDTYGHLLPGETRTAVTHIGKILSEARAHGTNPLPRLASTQ